MYPHVGEVALNVEGISSRRPRTPPFATISVLPHVSYGVDLEAMYMIEVHGMGFIGCEMVTNYVHDEYPEYPGLVFFVMDIFVFANIINYGDENLRETVL